MAQTTISAPQQQVAMPAVDLRQLFGSFLSTEGTRFSTDLSVTQRAAGANMSVDVSAGSAVINDDHAGGGGAYGYTLSATTNLVVSTADPTNPRVDRVVVRIRDQALGDAANDQAPVVVAGTPTAGATLANLSGAAAVPASSLLLANVLVPAASSSVTTANIDGSVKATLAAASGMVKLAPDPALTASAATIDFSGIPAVYTHLMIEVSARSDTAAGVANAFVRFNNDSTANYDHQQLVGSAAAASAAETFAASGAVFAFIPANTAVASSFGAATIWIPNYATTVNLKMLNSNYALKTGVATTNLGAGLFAGGWRSTAAINRITFVTTGNFVAGSRVSVYGIA